jgi:hypothetical protein
MYLKDFIIQLQEFFRSKFRIWRKDNLFVGKTVSENECTWCYLSFILRQSYFNPLQNIKHGEEFLLLMPNL